jgi:hypothetical protein
MQTVSVHPIYSTPQPWIAVVGCIAFILAVWMVAGSRYLFEEDNMERPTNRIPQLYGYSVCLIAVIVFIFSLQNLAENAVARNHPLESSSGYGASLDSFEAYQATYNNPPGYGYVNQDRSSVNPPEKLTQPELRARYEALRASAIRDADFRATQSMVVSGLLLAVAIVLFGLHWRWLRRQSTAIA